MHQCYDVISGCANDMHASTHALRGTCRRAAGSHQCHCCAVDVISKKASKQATSDPPTEQPRNKQTVRSHARLALLLAMKSARPRPAGDGRMYSERRSVNMTPTTVAFCSTITLPLSLFPEAPCCSALPLPTTV